MKHPLPVFIALCVLFSGYSAALYISGDSHSKTFEYSPELAANGKLVWQKYNCQSCHQLYGLGGYLGPDLTDVYSSRHGDEQALSAIIRSGNRSMPAYAINRKDMDALIYFLKAMDSGPDADPKAYKFNYNGMISYEK